MNNISPREPILAIEGLSVALPKDGDRPFAVEGISLAVRPKEIVCIVGESGSGKSVTAFGTMGLLPKNLKVISGSVNFGGVDLLSISDSQRKKLRGREMAMIFQEPMTALNPCYTVGDQIEEIFRQHLNLSARERRRRTLELLSDVKLPTPELIRTSYPHQLSGGQRQRIMIAMALALGPKLLLADEPTTALDVTTQAEILSLVKSLKDSRDAGIIFVTHDFGVVAEIADQVVVMKAGKIVESGTARDILNKPQHPYTRALIAAVPRLAGKASRDLDAQPELLTAEGVRKTFVTSGGLFRKKRVVHAVKDVSFSIRKGETLGIVGESGSGKSTLVRCLLGLLPIDGGRFKLDGEVCAEFDAEEKQRFRKNVQIVFQDPYGALNPRRKIGDLIVEGPVNFGESRGAALERAKALLDIVQLDRDCLDRYPSQFSGGQRQRICIARALAMEPRLLIADEAVSALDVSVQKEVLNLFADIREKFGLAMIFITHDMRVAAQVCDNVIVMKDGEIVEKGPVGDVFGAPAHPYTRALLAAEPGRAWTIPDLQDV